MTTRIWDHPAQKLIREAENALGDAYTALIDSDSNEAYGAIEEARGKLREALEKILEHDAETDKD